MEYWEGIKRVREQRMHAVQAITQYHMLQALVLEHMMGNVSLKGTKWKII